MMKLQAIRLRAPAILLAVMTFGAIIDELKAQTPAVQTSAAQASQSATKALLDKARAFEARGRMDLAVQVWQQILLAEPRNPEALSNLARAYRRSGDTRLADSYQARLREVSPNDTSLTGVQRAGPASAKSIPSATVEKPSRPLPVPAPKGIAPTTNNLPAPQPTVVEDAPPAGVLSRPSAAKPVPPLPPPAMRRGIAVAPVPVRSPSPAAHSEAQTARTLTSAEIAAYQALNADRVDDAETRFRAILASDPGNSKALAGMGYVRMQQGNFLGAIGFLEQAERNDAGDKGLLAALDTARFWFLMGEGQSALTANDLTLAEKHYRSALELRANSPEALEGLGGTLLRAQQPGPAIPLFERAVKAEPASVDGWRGLFMAQFQGGDAALALRTLQRIPPAALAQLGTDPLFLQPLASAYDAVGKAAEPQATLESALKQRFPPDVKGLKTDIQIQLAGMLAAANHLDQAADRYRQVLSEEPENLAAWQGLVRIQHAMGHDAEALKTVQSMPPTTYAAALRDPGFEIAVASIYQAENKLDVAQDLLQKAVTEQTNAGQKPSPAIEMQLAGLYIERGSPQLAYPVYQQVIHENPGRADAWAGLLSALHGTGHDQEAVAQLKLAPTGVRAQLETNDGYLQTMASVYAALGRSREATQFLSRVEQDHATERTAPPLDVEIQNAWLLYNGLDDSGLYRQLMSLGGRHDLTAGQRQTVQTIWTNWAARRANQATAAGNPPRALAILNAAARAFPDNLAAIKLLAIGYAQAGQPHQAMLIYRAQNMASASAPDYEVAVTSALIDGDNKDAEIWLRYALKAYPANPQILILAARFEQARGDTARAINYYRASLKVMPPVAPGSQLASDLGLPGLSAPSSLPSADLPQDLSILLAPGYIESNPWGGSSTEPSPPNNGVQVPLPPYDDSTRLVPPYMTNPGGKGDRGLVKEATLAPIGRDPATPHSQADVASTVRTAMNRALGGPHKGNPSAMAVHPADNTLQPVQAPKELTEVLPTVRNAPSGHANQAASSRAEVAATRADRVGRLQDDWADGRTGQSHPPSEDTITLTTQNAEYITPAQSSTQVAQPSTQPKRPFGNVPDTGAQQYPQPSSPPRPNGQNSIKRSRPTPRTPPDSGKSAPPPTPQPVVSQPALAIPPPAPAPVAANPAPTPQGFQSLPAIGPAYPLAPPPTDAELRARNLPPLGGYFAAQVPISISQRQQAESELAALEGSYSGWAGVTGIGRYRSGAAGLDRLYDVEAPAEASAVIGRSARLSVVALPVFLNSGVLGNSNFTTGNVPYLGTLAANSSNFTAQQYANGIGGELHLATRNIGLAVGYTPYEFPVRNFTGRLQWSGPGGHFSVYGERQPVKDTQLSYAGLHDPGAASPALQGPIWGGVVANTGSLRLNFSSAGSTFYVSGEGGILTGEHVLDNTRFGGTTGASFRVGNWPAHGTLKLGGALAGMHYAHNESGLSYGQGGYFSPSSYFRASVPTSFTGHIKTNFHYIIAGALGVQTFEQDEAPFFPLDPSLQNGFVPSNGASCTPLQAPSYNCGNYPLGDTTKFNYAFNSEAAYRFAQHWYGGGFVVADNSRNYNTVSAGFFLRYVFRAQYSLEGYPAGLFAVDGLRPLQIP